MRPGVLLAVASLIVLAGCGSAGGPSTASPAETLTPAPVPTTPASDATVDHGPNVTNGRVSDPWRFGLTHRRALWNTSYTVTINQTIVAGNETIQYLDRRARVEAGGDRYALTQRSNNTGYATRLAAGPEYGIWQTADRGWYRLAGPHHVQYGRIDGVRGRSGSDPTDHERVADLLTAFSIERRDLSSTRRVRYRLLSTGLVEPTALDPPPQLVDPRNASLNLLVDSAGIVRSYRVSYRATYRDRPVTVTRSLTITGVGSTTASPPDWLPAARNETRPDS